MSTRLSQKLLAVHADSVLDHYRRRYPALAASWHVDATVRTITTAIKTVVPTHTYVAACDGALRGALKQEGISADEDDTDTFLRQASIDSVQEVYALGAPAPGTARIGGLVNGARMFYVPGPVPYSVLPCSRDLLRSVLGSVPLEEHRALSALDQLTSRGVPEKVVLRIAKVLGDSPLITADDLSRSRGNLKAADVRDAVLYLKDLGFFDEQKAAEPSCIDPRGSAATPVDVVRHLPGLRMGSFERNYKLITDDDERGVQELLDACASSARIGVDTETTGLHIHDDHIIGLVIAPRPGLSYYIGHASEVPVIDERVRRVLEDPHKPKVFHNWVFDYARLRAIGINVAGRCDDTVVMAACLGKRDETAQWVDGDWQGGNLNLKRLAEHDLGYKMIKFDDITKGTKTLVGYDPADVLPYAAADADMTLQLFNKYDAALTADPVLRVLYENIELPVLPAVVDMEWGGVAIDLSALEAADHEIDEHQKRALGQIHEHTRGYVSIEDLPKFLNSPKKLSRFLFEELRLPRTPKRKTGYSTAANDLASIAYKHDIVGEILDYREAEKLRTSFTLAIPSLISKKTGRLHTSYNSTGTDTGRFSSSSPNVQNIPTRTPLGATIRGAFVAKEGHLLVGADYAQIELRIMAAESNDPVFRRAFLEGLDPYTLIAADFFDIAVEAVEKDAHRNPVKQVVLGTNYGLQADNLAKRRRISRQEAQAFLDRYFARHPRIVETQERYRQFAREHGYAQDMYGRRRYTPFINSKDNISRRLGAERIAVNMPIQGGAGSIFKLAIAKVWREVPAAMVLQVHDELVLESLEDEAKEIKEYLEEVLPSVATLPNQIPLVAEAKIGRTWKEAK